MPKVQQLGESMLRGNGTNFYIRCDDDLDDQDTDAYRGAAEYPHIHVATDGHTRWDNITYIGITFGGGARNIDIYRDDAYQINMQTVVGHITAYCPGISATRVHPLTQYLFGYTPRVSYQ